MKKLVLIALSASMLAAIPVQARQDHGSVPAPDEGNAQKPAATSEAQAEIAAPTAEELAAMDAKKADADPVVATSPPAEDGDASGKKPA